MQAKELSRRVSLLCEPIIKELSVDLWDITFEKEGPHYTLTVIIDRISGIDIEDCEKLSRALDPLLDAPEFDNLPAYTLCVSSAGLERTLRTEAHYNWAIGKQVEINFYKPHNGAKSSIGILNGYTNEETTIDGTPYKNSEISLCRQHFDFTTMKDN